MNTIKELSIKMINGDLNAEQSLKEHYAYYIKQLINKKYNNTNFNKNNLLNAGLEGLEIAITLYKQKHNEYANEFSIVVAGYIRKKIEAESKHQLNDYERVLQQSANKLFINDKIAKEEIFSFYENFITELCKQNNTCNIELNELKQVGYIGLTKAICAYRKNPTRYFSPIACNYIKKEIDIFIKNENRYIELEKMFPKLVDLPYEEIPYEDIITVKNSLNALKENHKEIMILYFYKGLTFQEIAKIYNVSYQRIEEIVRKSLLKMRNELTPKNKNHIKNKTKK